MALVVTIQINDKVIENYAVRNTQEKDSEGRTKYVFYPEFDDQTIYKPIWHRRHPKGATILAKEILERVIGG